MAVLNTPVLCVLFLQDKFIEYLLKGTENLTPAFALANNETISHIINLSSAILVLSNNKCDQETNPNPKVSSKQQSDSRRLPAVLFLCDYDVAFIPVLQSLFEDVFRIFRAIAQLLGTGVTERFVYRYPTGAIYQSR